MPERLEFTAIVLLASLTTLFRSFRRSEPSFWSAFRALHRLTTLTPVDGIGNMAGNTWTFLLRNLTWKPKRVIHSRTRITNLPSTTPFTRPSDKCKSSLNVPGAWLDFLGRLSAVANLEGYAQQQSQKRLSHLPLLSPTLAQNTDNLFSTPKQPFYLLRHGTQAQDQKLASNHLSPRLTRCRPCA